MKTCNEIQQLIAELEFNQIEDQAILNHIQICQDCQQYQQVLNEMNQAMGEMTDFDAEDSLVESTLSSIVSLQEESSKPKRLLNTQWASAMAASFMLVSLIALFPYNSISNFGLISDDLSEVKTTPVEEKRAIAKRKEALQRKKTPKKSDFDFYSVLVEDEVVQKQRRTPRKPSIPRLKINDIVENKLLAPSIVTSQMGVGNNSGEIKQGFSDGISNPTKLEAPKPIYSRVEENKPQSVGNELAESVAEYEDDQDKVALDRVVTTGSHIRAVDLSTSDEQEIVSGFSVQKYSKDSNSDPETLSGYSNVFAHRYSKTTSQDDEGSSVISNHPSLVAHNGPHERYDTCCAEDALHPDPNVVGKFSKAKEKSNLDIRNSGLVGDSDDNIEQRHHIESKSETAGTLNSPGRKNTALEQGLADTSGSRKDNPVKSPIVEEAVIAPLTLANQYLSDNNSLDSLNFQNASGYWANTYLPGDSSMRLLQASLTDNTTMTISNSISQNIQPFDYPTNSALAVYLNSDVANVVSQTPTPTRMRIQVGIQAANRQGGQRSAMNMGLVFDLRNKTQEYATSMKALLLELLKSKQPGDNISLTVVGTGANGILIEPKDFRHGQIQVVMNNLFANQAKKAQENTNGLSLTQAIQLTTKQLQNNDDQSATLGASVIMLFSANNINDIASLESIVHKNAVKGITLSTVSLGLDNQQQLKKLALAGQGHARILQSTHDAKRVIDAELLASSRAVARALRLRIRLAKGVKLIEVLDSYNLNEKQSQRVRDAEQSLDKRLSKNLGIETDRGEDEEGIQIVIPSFFAGDTHVVLLDVVVANKGAIADVSVRYKDLLYLRNAVSREQLNLQNTPKSQGPLQLNVMKNVLASRFANTIKQAGKHIRNGKNTGALLLLQEMQSLYQSMRAQFPAWNKDQEILQDEKLLQEYITILNSVAINDVQKINYIIDSMQYISWRKQITAIQ